MSTLTIKNLQGLTAYSNTITIPAGHVFDVQGNVKIPTFTTSTRPTTTTVGLIGYNTQTTTVQIYTGSTLGWVDVGKTQNDGTSSGQAVAKSTDILTANSSASTGWYWIKTNNVARQYYVDCSFSGGGWVMVGSHPINVSIPALTYAQAAQSYDGYASSTYGSGDPKTYSLWVGLRAWDDITTANGAGKNFVYYTAGSQVSLSNIGSHSRRSSWKWTGWGSAFAWSGANSLSNDVGGTTPGLWGYHIGNSYNFTTYDVDQDVYGANCAQLYNNSPWWYGACWDGNFWGGNGTGYANAAFWTGSGGDYYSYGAMYVK
jgi:hypothetical protein